MEFLQIIIYGKEFYFMALQADRRVRKTRHAIRRGLIQLMKEKGINEITVKELADMLDINRGTFYRHYKDLYDLLDTIENEMFEEFEQTLNKYSINNGVHHNNIENQSPLPIFLELFQFLANNSDMCLFLLSDKADNEFIDKLLNSGKNKYFRECKIMFGIEDLELLEINYTFIASGCIGLIRYWLANGMKQSPKEMASIAEQMILHSTKMLNS